MRVADLVNATPLPQIFTRINIDHQPALLEAQVPHPCSDVFAHQAVCAVAAQQIVAPQAVLTAIGAIGERDAGAAVAEAVPQE